MSVDKLIAESQYGEKIKYLLANQQLAERKLHERGMKPCCFGTTAHIIGAAQKVKSFWQQTGHTLEDYSDAAGDYVCIPDEKGPGYIGRRPMALFLSTRKIGAQEPGEITAFSWESPRSEFYRFELRHTAIYLGRDEHDQFFFEQESEGLPFRINTMVGFIQELSRSELSSLRISWYKSHL